jgi:signal transduction histidine kinase
MKLLGFILFFFLFMGKVFSQKPSVRIFNVDSLPVDGLVLNKEWKFHADDNLQYAQPGFDDGLWGDVDPTKDIHELPMLWQNNVVWFRLHFSLDSNLNKQSLSLLVEQTGASEIYLNGQLLKQFGKINNSGKQIIAATPPNYQFIGLLYSNPGEYTLAIRFAIEKGLPYVVFASRSNTAMVLTLMNNESINNAIQNDKSYLIYFRAGIFFIIAILHFTLFYFYRAQKANLIFFIYALLFTFMSLLERFTYQHTELASAKMYFLIAVFSAFLLGLLFFLTAVYKLFEFKPGVIYGLIVGCCVISHILFFLNYSQGGILGPAIFPIIIFFESIRITFLALKTQKRGAIIMLGGAGSFVVFFTIFLLIFFDVLPAGPNWIYGDIAFLISLLSLPVATSVYLALESTFASKSLKEKLSEVQYLSKKTISQEQEKQQILANQNITLENQVTERTRELKQSLENLKSTQAQLIHSEKMASLGELTAGIAHEIQNPLNFVNNFSEVNSELLAEMNQEIDKGNYEDAKEIAKNVIDNQEKINHHGRRADGIVKGMLQHTKSSTGVKEPTSINKLADEYLRLAYHGFRAKDKDFHAAIPIAIGTDFDISIGKINVIPQDIGRVLLNLFNNAFYAVNERLRQAQPDSHYEPTVTVSTKKLDDKIEIKVADNGNGIPQNMVDKIFQPFFTTKPTGQGTGLGLSLSYDIIKAHGGEIKVETKEGQGTEFIIELPFASLYKDPVIS